MPVVKILQKEGIRIERKIHGNGDGPQGHPALQIEGVAEGKVKTKKRRAFPVGNIPALIVPVEGGKRTALLENFPGEAKTAVKLDFIPGGKLVKLALQAQKGPPVGITVRHDLEKRIG